MSEHRKDLAIVAQALPDAVLDWTYRATVAAPSLPAWLLVGVAWALSNPGAGSDALCLLADSLEVMAVAAAVDGRVPLVRELRALADLPRMLAPERASAPVGALS